MCYKKLITKILVELTTTINDLNEKSFEKLSSEILKADTIFVSASGRSFLAIKAFAMRLMQIGLKVYVKGEIVTPAIKANDLLIIASGSGETAGPINNAETAKKIGARVALITTNANSTLANLADLLLIIPTKTEKLENAIVDKEFVQIGGNAFEQLVLIIGDAIVIKIKDQYKDSQDSVMNLHANLE